MNKKGILVTLSGVALIVIGVLWTLHELRIIHYSYQQWWVPVVLIVIGIAQIFASSKIVKFTGLFSACLGVLFLLATLGKLHWAFLAALWPVIFASIGIGLLFM